jgi:hypothetical protein
MRSFSEAEKYRRDEPADRISVLAPESDTAADRGFSLLFGISNRHHLRPQMLLNYQASVVSSHVGTGGVNLLATPAAYLEHIAAPAQVAFEGDDLALMGALSPSGPFREQ